MTKKLLEDQVFYTCKHDVAFKEIFMNPNNKDLLIVLLESCLPIKIMDLEYINLEIKPATIPLTLDYGIRL